MTLITSPGVIRYGFSTIFSPVGGTGPYDFVVLPGGAGGSIDSSGIYTAPLVPTAPENPRKSIATIQVTDSLSATATATINVLQPLELVCEIIRQGLGLSGDQVYIYNQKYLIPNDSRLYIPIEVLSPKPFGNTNKIQEIDGVLTQVQSVNFATILSIDAMSRSTVALYRKEEIIMALNSLYSQQLQQAFSFYLAPITSAFVAVNEEDGAAIPYRFNMSVTIQYAVEKYQTADYYDSFEAGLYGNPLDNSTGIPFGPDD